MYDGHSERPEFFFATEKAAREFLAYHLTEGDPGMSETDVSVRPATLHQSGDYRDVYGDLGIGERKSRAVS